MTSPHIVTLACGCFFRGRDFHADPACAEHGKRRGRPSAVPQLADEIVSLYQSGWTIRKVADAFGVSETAVRNKLVAADVPRRLPTRNKGSKLPPSQTTIEMADLYLHGWSMATIARTYGITKQSVLARLARAGVPSRPQGTGCITRHTNSPE